MTAINLSDEAVRARIMLELQGIIAYPHDAEAQRQFWCIIAATMAEGCVGQVRDVSPAKAATASRFLKVWEGLYQECGGRRTLLDAPCLDEVLEGHHKRLLRALLAGWVLAIILAKARAEPGQASVNKAKEAVRQELPEDVTEYLAIPRSHRPIDETWAHYRPVSHLAAGLLNVRPVMLNPRAIAPNGSLVGMPGTPLALSVHAGESDLRAVLRGAATALREAGSLIPHAQSVPVLPPGEARRLPRWAEPYDEPEHEWSPQVADLAGVIQRSVQGISSVGLLGV